MILLCRYCLFTILDLQRATEPEVDNVVLDFAATSPAVAVTVVDGDAMCAPHFSEYISHVATASRIINEEGPPSDDDAATLADLCRLTQPGHSQVIALITDAVDRLGGPR